MSGPGKGDRMSNGISALVFDAYGTLFDVHSVTRLADSLFPGRGAALSSAWRAKQLEYTWLVSLMGRYEDFNHVTRVSLEWALESLGLEADAATLARLQDEYRRLAPFPEVPAALERLAGVLPLAILSNGHPEMLQSVVAHNRFEAHFRGRLISVHAAKIFKPSPLVYGLVEERLGVPRSMVGFVSSNGWDVAGAKAFGFRTWWINRAGAPLERLGVRPDTTIVNLGELDPLA